ncbi:GC-type dockerin domain-anchored protein [Synechococcus sp. Cruz CV-v-12]|uniref:GC-type dockerin domain-anchored protein n=1 Tax=Synechococcus sp. Cruz CV-v-12 TaxID=2823728 RepID=UPI0020CCF81E|nr:GC-type dockerin domain-anchored protein [Synechococcus sp. Cruz CV-v-12]MCP9874381.1 FG-GAP repeat protein [Synechococcus sp. Cruz CV-v-12]
MCISPLRAVSFLALLAIVLASPARADDASVPKGLAPSDWSSIRAAYEAGRHKAYADEATPGHFVTRNPGQQWRTRYDGRGFLTTPNAGGWTWGLDLISYGRGDSQQTITGVAITRPSGSRVEYAWSHALTEWYINDHRGFEHGYTLHERPHGPSGANTPGGGMLHFTLAVRGDLRPRVSESGRDVTFTTAAGNAALTYNNLKVFDADGVHLAASFRDTTTGDCTPALLLTIDDTHARYPLTIDPIAQQAYLKASNTGNSDAFGWALAASGDTVVVGALAEDSNSAGVNGNEADNSVPESGAAYVFVRSGGLWTQQAYLKASNTGNNDRFGCSVTVSGDTVVVGAYQEDSNSAGVNGDQANNVGFNTGAAYVFLLNPRTPTSSLATPASVCDSGDPVALSVNNTGADIVIDWFTDSCGGTLVGTGNPFNVTPATTTTYFARARRTSDGNTSDACASVTVTVAACGCGPSDIAGPGQAIGPDSQLTADDIIVYLNWFFAGDSRADVAGPGQSTVTDGQFTADDIIVFLNRFFAGC